MLGDNIRSARVDSGMTQDDLGEIAGIEVSKQEVSRWENNIRCPSLSKFKAICNALDVSSDKMLDRDK